MKLDLTKTNGSGPPLMMSEDGNFSIHPVEYPIELRALSSGQCKQKSPLVGHYDNLEVFHAHAKTLNEHGYHIYSPINPILPGAVPDLNGPPAKGNAVSNENIERRVTLPYDIDAKRPKDLAATDKEKEEAKKVADAVIAFWQELGVTPEVVDSGNGYQVKVPIELPNDGESHALVKAVLEKHKQDFDTAAAKIDVLPDAARVMRVPGYMNLKGDNSPDRPFRRARLLQKANGRATKEMLEQVVDATSTPVPILNQVERPHCDPADGVAVKKSKALVDQLIENAKIPSLDWRAGHRPYIWKATLPEALCPHHETHSTSNGRTTFVVTIDEKGAIGANCQHANCSEVGWVHVRQKLEDQFAEAYKSPDLPSDNITRLDLPVVDYIDQLADELTRGAAIPFSFMRETLKMLLLAGLPEFPAPSFNKCLHGRQYVILLSETAGSGKGESWRRGWETLKNQPGFLDKYLYRHVVGTSVGSPELAVLAFGGVQIDRTPKKKQLLDEGTSGLIVCSPGANKNRNIFHFDEGEQLLIKDGNGGGKRGLTTMLTSLFESNFHSMGSFKNGKAVVEDANVSTILHFVRDKFDQSLSGSGAGTDGFLSRFTIISDHKNNVLGNWREVDDEKVTELMKHVEKCMERTGVFFTPDAEKLREKYTNKIREWDQKMSARLEALFAQDIIARSMFSVNSVPGNNETEQGIADVEAVERAFKWVENQYETRQKTWPQDDSSDKYERMSRQIQKALQKYGRLSRPHLWKAIHITRPGSGGKPVFDRVIGSVATIVAHTKRNSPIYELKD